MSITLLNSTPYIAQFIICQGERIVSRLPGIAPGAQMIVPVQRHYEIVASTLIDGNLYTAAPVFVDSRAANAPAFLAQVLQQDAQGTFDFNVVTSLSPVATSLNFQKTCRNPVTFTFSRNGRVLQHVVVDNSFRAVALDVSDVITAYAVINGITTATVRTSNSNAAITAVQDSSTNDGGAFTLTAG